LERVFFSQQLFEMAFGINSEIQCTFSEFSSFNEDILTLISKKINRCATCQAGLVGDTLVHSQKKSNH
jgi:hypothetical protein